MTLRYLVLFDIDGTLLWSDGSGREAMRRALVHTYGTAGPVDEHPFAGRTDRAIVQGLLHAAGLTEEEIAAGFEALSHALEEELRQGLDSGAHHVRPCPGAPELIRIMADHDDILLGLLTGNLSTTAHLKLEAAGYVPALFRVGAFGGESTERSDLVPLAVQRAQAVSGTAFEGKHIVVIGDTPADVTCGEALGVRTIAVLTGGHSLAELEAAHPDFIFDALSPTGEVLAAVFAP